MVDRLQGGLIPNRPALGAGLAAEIDILIVKKIVFIQAAQLLEAFAAQQPTATSHPGYTASSASADRPAFAADSGPSQSRQGADQARKRTGRPLWSAIAVPQLKTDDTSPGIFPGQAVGQVQDPIEKTLGRSQVRVQDQKPRPLAKSKPFVDGTGETTVSAPAANGNARPPPQFGGQRMGRGMVIDNDDFRSPAPQASGLGQFAHQAGGFFPLPIVDNYHR
jgi:hypothetical protein